MNHKNFPYALTNNYKLIYEFLNNNSNFFLIAFTEITPDHIFKIRKTIYTGEVVIVDSHNCRTHARAAEEFEKICKGLKLLIIEPEKHLK